jgi:hypothetical protein
MTLMTRNRLFPRDLVEDVVLATLAALFVPVAVCAAIVIIAWTALGLPTYGE